LEDEDGLQDGREGDGTNKNVDDDVKAMENIGQIERGEDGRGGEGDSGKLELRERFTERLLPARRRNDFFQGESVRSAHAGNS